MQHRQTTISRVVGAPTVAIIAISLKIDGVIALSCIPSSTPVENNIMSLVRAALMSPLGSRMLCGSGRSGSYCLSEMLNGSVL